MMAREDPRLSEAQALQIGEIVDRLRIDGLRRSGAELAGPCPVCGGRDRFGVNVHRGVFNCRRCDQGGDGIKLVQFVMECDFKAALDWLCGERDLDLDPAVAERRRRDAENKRRRAEDYARRKRQGAIVDAKRIWQECRPAEGSDVERYLECRGIRAEHLPRMPMALRYHPDLPYMVSAERGWQEIHRGPAMVAGIQAPSKELTAIHRTWIDLAEPKGKLRLLHEGAPMVAKKVHGSKKGGAIRLHTPNGGNVMVMGEGIETTLTALVADAIPGAAYWCGVDLGNMAGRRKLGQGLKYAGLPDMSDADAFVPPPWVRRLIFIQDGDSEPRLTRAKLESGLRRAMALVPGLKGQIVHAGEGRDLNDVLMGSEGAE